MAVVIKLPTKKPEKPSYEDVLKMANALPMASHPDELANVLKAIAMGQFNALERETLIQVVQQKTKLPKKSLRQHLKLCEQELGLLPNDFALEVARTVRNKQFKNGAHLLRNVDDSYWRFSESHWEITDRGELRKLLLEESNKVFHLFDGSSLSTLVNQAWSCLNDLLGTDQDILNLVGDPPPVVNVANGELWIAENGEVTLTPHRPESRITYCLPIEYDPKAQCPKYDKALMEIFSKASDPGDMVRHWHEFVGFVIQPLRDVPSFWLLIGHGANGKTRLLQTLQRLLGPNTVLNDSIARFMGDRFNIA